MKRIFITSQVVAAAGLLVASTAFAQPDKMDDHEHRGHEADERAEERAADEEADRARERTRVTTDRERDVVIVEREAQEAEEGLLSPYGASVFIGGGLAGFATDEMTDVTDLGGSWEARFAAGTETPIGVEVGYTGTAQGLDALGLDEDAVLLGNGAEALGRVNAVNDTPIKPYAFGGAGYRNYRITNSDQNTSNLANNDDLFEVPVGAGVSVDLSESLILDARGQYRFAFGEDLTAPGADEDGVGSDLNSWGASLRLGYEF